MKKFVIFGNPVSHSKSPNMHNIAFKALNIDEIVPFSQAKVEGVSTDTLRKVLHRLHDKGVITIVERGHFKKEELFRELLFVYGSLKKGFDTTRY